ncbi:unnamed protein product, partial [Amoebophrya sp. A25]
NGGSTAAFLQRHQESQLSGITPHNYYQASSSSAPSSVSAYQHSSFFGASDTKLSEAFTGSFFCDDVNIVIRTAQERKGTLDCLMSVAHAISIPAFGVLCDKRGRKYMLIFA